LRAVLDTNVLISALLSRTGAPAELIARWRDGAFELIVSPLLLEELSRALAYPKVRDRVDASDAAGFVRLLREQGSMQDDPEEVPKRAADRADDYVLALAESQKAVVVSGDQHLIDLAGSLPVFTPRELVGMLEAEG
jgi:uncharacterized protein